eukprot:gene8783-biopygen7091
MASHDSSADSGAHDVSLMGRPVAPDADRIKNLEDTMATIVSLLSRGQGAGVAVIPGAEATSQTGEATVSQGSPVNPATAPSFLRLAPQHQDGPAPLPVGSGVAMANSVGSAALVSQPSTGPPMANAVPVPTPGVSVSSALPPVPGYLVEQIQANQYVDFTLLRPGNLKKLPASEPTSTQLAKLLRTELGLVRDFLDWAEAWAVYMGIVLNKDPEKMAGLISYFLLLASAFRDIPGGGWLEYDISFRKHVAENPSTNWGEILPTLWMTTVMAKASMPAKGSSVPPSSRVVSRPCFRWNNGNCDMVNCRFQHQCQTCKGAHPECRCPNRQSSSSRKQPAESSPPVARKRSYQK